MILILGAVAMFQGVVVYINGVEQEGTCVASV